tara:strand:- start:320 stop:1582 length:1263 start_codon:yes stop_codon:yes gene_type:complete
MKWIGQHIWDFLSRFRSDVYLEGTESGTIASGGNLGLDSNNKIVKATTPSGGLTIADASNDYIVTSTGGTGLAAESDFRFYRWNNDPQPDKFLLMQAWNPKHETAGINLMLENNSGFAYPSHDENRDNDGMWLRYRRQTALSNSVTHNINVAKFEYHGFLANAAGTNENITGVKVKNNTSFGSSGTMNFVGVDIEHTGSVDSNTGLLIKTPDSYPTNTDSKDIKIVSSAESGDYFYISTGTDGETVIATEENGGGATAHLTLDIDGDIIFKPGNDISFYATPPGCYNNTTIKIMPNEFIVGDRAADPLVIEDDEDSGNEFGVRAVNSLDTMYAFVKIPNGMKATHCNVHASSSVTNGVTTYSYNYQDGANDALSSTTFNVGSNTAITNIPSSATQDMVIKIDLASDSIYVHGATVTIANI